MTNNKDTSKLRCANIIYEQLKYRKSLYKKSRSF